MMEIMEYLLSINSLQKYQTNSIHDQNKYSKHPHKRTCDFLFQAAVFQEVLKIDSGNVAQYVLQICFD